MSRHIIGKSKAELSEKELEDVLWKLFKKLTLLDFWRSSFHCK